MEDDPDDAMWEIDQARDDDHGYWWGDCEGCGTCDWLHFGKCEACEAVGI